MTDPLSVTASLVAITTIAIQSTKMLYETVKRYKDRNKTLRRLEEELLDLNNMLESLMQVPDAEQSMLTLLQGPVERCSQVCREFSESMEVFSQKSKTGFRDWTKMEFMRGDMNDFIETIAGYKATISVGLATITLRTVKISQKVLHDYNEMIKDTAYALELRLHQIDEKMAQLNIENTNTSGVSIDLEDEREVTKQCLRVCGDARSYIDSLSDRESSLFREAPQNIDSGDLFEAQLRTRQTLDGNSNNLAATMSHLQKRLESLFQNDNPAKDHERSQLQADVDIYKQCLDVCKVATETSRQKVYRIGEVIAEGDSDQVVVTTLADLFDIKKAYSKGHSAQLVGSMTEANLQSLTEQRYSSRFGAVVTSSGPVNIGEARTSQSSSPPQTAQSVGPRRTQNKPAPNEIRKRQGDDGLD